MDIQNEVLEYNLVDSDEWLSAPDIKAIERIPLSTERFHDLYCSKDYSHKYSVLIRGYSLVLYYFEINPNKRSGHRAFLTVNGKLSTRSFIVYSDEKISHRQLIETFCFGA